MSITVLNPGLLTIVQDLGRMGYQQFGVPVAGVLDPRAAAIANILVGNAEGEAVLECAMLGPSLRFEQANTIAVTGGDLGLMVDERPASTYRPLLIEAGQELRFTGLKTGCRCFIAFAGGLDIPPVMGSRSTYTKAKIGGFQGRKLAKGDELAFRAPRKAPGSFGIVPEFVPRSEYAVRVILGPQDDAFTPEGLNVFLGEPYMVTAEFDRMGCRLDGPVIAHKATGDIISDGISFGAVQVPSAGKPIVMLADRQTTGGYTKIAHVISRDFGILAQLKAGDKLRFVPVSIQFAQQALLRQRTALQALRHAAELWN